MNAFKSILLAFLVATLATSCATTGQSPGGRKNSLPAISQQGFLNEGDGILLMSAGRNKNAAKEDGTNFAGILPFISYHLLRKTDDLDYEELAFIPAEAGLRNQLDKGCYGYIHYRELPAGDYVAIGNKSRGQSVLLPPGIVLSPGNRTTEIAFEFSIKPGEINYIGELMTMRGFSRNDDIRITDQHERDVAFLLGEHEEVTGLLVDVRLAKPINDDKLPVPDVLQ